MSILTWPVAEHRDQTAEEIPWDDCPLLDWFNYEEPAAPWPRDVVDHQERQAARLEQLARDIELARREAAQ